jgi:predicted ATPase/DNA-binding SARP family transcriptional activator
VRVADDTRLDIRALGPLEVDVDGRRAALGGPKQRCVLSLLSLRANTTVSVDDLAAAVWGEDANVSDVLDALRVYLSNLRAVLDPGRSRGSVGSRLLRDGGGYRLCVRPEELDVLRFSERVGAGRRSAADGELPQAAASLAAAEQLWRGDPFPDLVDVTSVRPDLGALAELRLSALEDRVDVELALGRHGRLVGEVRALTQANPLRERLRAQLMLALYRSGRQDEALAVYADLRSTLAESLGVDPTPAVQTLHRAILGHEPALDPPRETAAPSTCRYHVPVPPNALVGRSQDLAQLVERLRTARGRIVTLVGTGGVGKTRLALAAASALEPEHVAGACWVPLAGLSDPALVPQAVAAGLGLTGFADQDAATAIAEHLRATDVLLVLDNFEHLLPAAHWLADLLAEVPVASVVVTSRSPLGLSTELEVPVEPLPLPNPRDAIADVSREPAVRLFVERAQAVDPKFRLDEESTASVASVCRHLDGLPLAIELAAARIRVLSPAAIAARLDHALTLLTTGARDLPSRQRTLRATLEWSYDLLPASQRRLLGRLGVFAGGGRVSDIEAVCGFPPLDVDLLDDLDALVRHSLVQLRRDGAGEPRLVLLETVREFALERLQSDGDEDEVGRRHAVHYAGQLEDVGQQAGSTVAQRTAMAWCTAEQENLRAALRWSSQGPDGIGTGVRLIAGLSKYWEVTSALEEGLSWCRRLLGDDLDTALPGAAAALNAAGTLAWLEARHDEARVWHRRALEVQQRSSDVAAQAWSMICLGAQDLSERCFEDGERWVHRGRALARTIGDERLQRIAVQCLGTSQAWQGNLLAALRLAERGLAMARREGDERDIASMLNNLSDVTLQLGDPLAALALVQESLTILHRLGDVTYLVSGLCGVADIAVSLGAPDRALRLLAAVSAVCETTGLRRVDLTNAVQGPTRSAAFTALGDAAAAAAWGEGLTIGIDRAVEEALSLEAATAMAAARLA